MSKLTVKQQRWQAIIEDWQQSGLGQAEYCRQHQLNPQRFYAWKHQLKDKQKPSPQKTGGFLPVVWDHAELKAEQTLKIHCQGVDIEITHQTDPDLLKKTVQWLGELS